MSDGAGPLKGNLTVVRGDLTPREISPEQWLDREMRSLFASWKSDNGAGAYPSRGIANVAHEINYPHRIPARRIREAHEAKVRHELVRRFGMLLCEYADRVYRKQVGQADSAA